LGAAEIEEGKVCLLLAERVRVRPQRQFRRGMAELTRHPAHTLAGGQGE